MPRLVWSTQTGSTLDVGVDQSVFYAADGTFEIWNGLVSVDEVVSDALNVRRYMDGQPLSRTSQEKSFSATIQAYSYPESLNKKYGRPFSFTYRVKTLTGYKIHLVYNARASIASVDYEYESAQPFDIDIVTTPMAIERAKPSAHLMIDSETTLPEPLAWLENTLYGSETMAPRMPTPQDIIEFFEEYEPMRVYKLPDGKLMIVGPSSRIEDLGDDRWAITSDATLSYVKNGNGVNSFSDDV